MFKKFPVYYNRILMKFHELLMALFITSPVFSVENDKNGAEPGQVLHACILQSQHSRQRQVDGLRVLPVSDFPF